MWWVGAFVALLTGLGVIPFNWWWDGPIAVLAAYGVGHISAPRN